MHPNSRPPPEPSSPQVAADAGASHARVRDPVTRERARSAVNTHLFTDIEGSSRLWEHQPERMREALAHHDSLVRAAIEKHRGEVVKTLGDGVHAVFDDPLDALEAALALQCALAGPDATSGIALPVRCGINLGYDERRGDDYYGNSVNRAARIMACAHGGQVLVSEAVSALVGDRLAAPTTLRDLGSVQLRGLQRPERVFQLVHPSLRRTLPALRSLTEHPNNLPSPVTSFVGRTRELAQVACLLRNTRLLSLVGPGGIGKTRLSIRASVEALGDFPDGAWFVELAPLTEPRLVAQKVASVLGVNEGASRSVAEAVAGFVSSRRLLIVLDSCEHLLSACAELAAQWLQASDGLKLLVSSREPLHIAGEALFVVPPLATPGAGVRVDAASLTHYEAARLFIERVASTRPSLQLAARDAEAAADICRRLDGIPLALELAAVQCRSLAIETVAQRLSDRFHLLTRGDKTALPRHQTLRASIDWSYELLADRERILLRRLAAFAGGWAIEAAESVCSGAGLPESEVMDALANLVEKSLVAFDAERGRYHLLDTVHQYARERLQTSDEERDLRARHLAWFLALAERSDAGGDREGTSARLAQLDLERENLLAAFVTSASFAEGAAAGLRLSYAIRRWFVSRGLLAMGERLMSQALDRDGAQARDAARCRALWAAGEIAFLRGRYDEAGSRVSESLAIARELGDDTRIAEALRLLGYVSLANEAPSAQQHFEAALSLSRRLGDRSQIASALNGLGELHRTKGDWRGAQPLYEEAVALDRSIGDRRRLAVHLSNLATVLIASGASERAAGAMLEAAAISAEIGSKQVGRAVLECAAGLGALREDWTFAVRLYAAAQSHAEQMGYHREPMDEKLIPPLVARARAALGAAAFAQADAEGRSLAYEDAMSQARAWLERVR